jgi:catechol 2,3-dioxygenase-like lactoylglutathione lyase family enzyme
MMIGEGGSMDERLRWPTWIGIVVEDLERQRRFWGDLLGLPENESGPDYVDFDLGEGRRLELVRRSDEPEYDRPRFQVGFEVDHVATVREELIRRGVEAIGDVQPNDVSPWAYLRDPEGNVFEIKQRVSDEV